MDIDWDRFEEEVVEGRVRREGFWERARDVRVFGQSVPELAAGFIAGTLAKNATRSALIGAGFSSWGLAIGAGALTGAAMSGGREYFRQIRESWRPELDPTVTSRRDRLRERLRDLTPTDTRRLGMAIGRGALMGAVGGFAGAALLELGNSLFEFTQGSGEEIPPRPSPPSTPTPDQPLPLDGDLPPKPTPESDIPPTPNPDIPPPNPPDESYTPTDPEPLPPPSLPPETPTTDNPLLPEPEIITPSPDQIIADNIQNINEDLILQSGSNPWNEARNLLTQVLPPGTEPSNAQILEVTKRICIQNDIAVPAWGLSGHIPDTMIQANSHLKIDDKVKDALAKIALAAIRK